MLGATNDAVTTKAIPISATSSESTFRKNWCRPFQNSASSRAVKNTARPSWLKPAPSEVSGLDHSRTTSVTIAITPMIEASCVRIRPRTMNRVTAPPKCFRKMWRIVSPETMVHLLMPTNMTCVRNEARISVQVSDMP